MMNDANTLLAACGLYCGACYHYRASFYPADRLRQEAARRGRPSEGFTCRGCRSDALYIHPGCAQCAIRACADEKGIRHCGLCADFPCDRLRAFRNDGRLHHQDIFFQLERAWKIGPEAWLAEQAQRWQCECGEPYSWYEEICSNCGKALASYGADPTLGQKHDGH